MELTEFEQKFLLKAIDDQSSIISDIIKHTANKDVFDVARVERNKLLALKTKILGIKVKK